MQLLLLMTNCNKSLLQTGFSRHGGLSVLERKREPLLLIMWMVSAVAAVRPLPWT